MTSVTQAHITCHCGAIQMDGANISASSHFPIDRAVCHCDDCRHHTGGLYLATFTIREAPSAALLASCTAYGASAKLRRYFCQTCGSFAFLHKIETGRWGVGSGLVEQSAASKAAGEEFAVDVIRITHHYWLDDTRDYKLAARLQRLGGRSVDGYAGDYVGIAPVAREKVQRLAARTDYADGGDWLEARCHCGGVDFRIARPDWSGLPTSAQPPTQHQHKLRAAFCACRDCRQTAGGASILPWAFVPPRYISTPDGKPVTFGLQGPDIPGLFHYESTRGKAVRSCCRTCGARVLYWNADRPQIVSIAVGILRAPEGAAAGNWLWWRPTVLAEGDAVDREILEALQDGEALERTQ